MTEQSKTRIPTPLYAAAGAGDLAVEQLRKLPARVYELREKAAAGDLREKATTRGQELREKATSRGQELREKATTRGQELREKATARLKAANETATELREKATTELDVEHLREVARRNANAVLAEAKAAQARAVELYHQLVARGERVVGSGVVEVAETVNADIEATEAAEVTATPSDVAAIDKPAVVREVPAEAKDKTGAKDKSDAKEATEVAKTPVKRTRPAARKQ